MKKQIFSKTIQIFAIGFSVMSGSGMFSGSVAAADSGSGLTWGGFVDTYYGYDVNQPATFDRAFTTQPARHNEFNVNLAYIEAKLERDRVHGRLALQFGTSVQSNYSNEPAIGNISGPSVSRHVQEGFVGYRIGKDTWIDAGIMLSHIGLENFISKDNLTYSRSFVADYTPYYETGARLTTKFSDKFSAQLLVLNGWQIISENNQSKAIGTQLSYAFSPAFSLTYNTFFGREFAYRHFHDFVLKYNPNDSLNFAAQADVGYQENSVTGGSASWVSFTSMAKYFVTKTLGIVGRVERYSDPKQVIVPASNGFAFKSWGASLGVDALLDNNFWWRNEIRGFFSDASVFPTANGFKNTDGVVVSSLSLAI